MYGRGVKEILRHHATERHSRRDQRWRYHLQEDDSVTKVVTHQVRGCDRKILTPYQLELEFPDRWDVEFVEIGESCLFTRNI